ncbi:MAG: DKNYY domain-containing protein [Flavobacteriales bacterium]|nr:DKNYY domain-containing protein [Flavobacteriales bacterium]
MKSTSFLLGALMLVMMSCSEESTSDISNEQKSDPQYEKAIAKIAKIDSLNATLEWQEVKPGIWLSNAGYYGIQESRMVYLDSMLFVTDYITKIDSTPIGNIINLPTFDYLGNQFYKDAFHVYNYYPMAYGGIFRILDTADAGSFHIVGDCYAQDKNFVYTEKGEIVEEVDYNSFFTTIGAGCFAKDQYGYFFWDERIEEGDLKDSLTIEYMHLLDEAANRMDTVYSEKSSFYMNDLTGKTKINYGNFKLEIDAQFETKSTKDTTYLYEWVGEYVYGRNLTIKPKNEADTFHIYIQTIDWLSELKESDSLGYLGTWDDWDPFTLRDTSNKFYWKSTSNKNKYIFPNIGNPNDIIMQKRIQQFELRDTSYWYHGEMSGDFLGEAWLCESKIVDYYVFTAIITIERHNNGLLETKWLQVEFSYGC